jgi:hypothetical protein
MRRSVVVFVVVMAMLTVVSALWPRPPSPLAVSSFGKAGSGHGALYDLLSESGLARGRSFEAGRRLEDPGPIWWIDPVGVCDGRIARRGEVDVLDEQDVAWPVRDWIRAGGVAVVFLQSAEPGGPVGALQEELVACDAIAGVGLPERKRLERDEPGEASVVEGPLTGGPRRIPIESPFAFAGALDWAVAARVGSGGSGEELHPFVLSRSLGEGLLVVVADSGFTHNRWLDGRDSAPLALDFARAFGTPRFDEREHGFLPETSAFRYIASSQALPAYLGLLFLGLLYAWRGNALPPRRVREFDPATPTLETWVASMAALYAGTRDHDRVFERYRELTASRLRRHFGLPQEVSRLALADRIERDRKPTARLAWLREDRAVTTEAELTAGVRELDALVAEVIR